MKLLILLLLIGCATQQANYARPYCVPNSIYAAWTWGAEKRDPVRVAIQNLEPGIDHAQAEAKIKGKWTPLTEIWDSYLGSMKIVPWDRHFPPEPYRYPTLREFISENYKWTHQEAP